MLTGNKNRCDCHADALRVFMRDVSGFTLHECSGSANSPSNLSASTEVLLHQRKVSVGGDAADGHGTLMGLNSQHRLSR